MSGPLTTSRIAPFDRSNTVLNVIQCSVHGDHCASAFTLHSEPVAAD